MEKNKNIDILCVGEVLIDFIGHQKDVRINNTEDYHRYLGGSPSNVAINAAKIGLKSSLVASIGNDGFGEFILKQLEASGVKTDNINRLRDKTTSVIFVSRSQDTPEFIPYRQADNCISEEQISVETLSEAYIFHTTSFALSREPAQSTILSKAAEAFKLGCQLSIDVNYAQELWNSQEEALKVTKAYCKFNPLIKVSEDDMSRLLGKGVSHEQIFEFFNKEGVDTICLTLGKDGVKLFQKGQDLIQLPALKVEDIMDTTGAGDAFWSGFLYGFVKKKEPKECLEIALKLAAIKLQNIGGLPSNINL